MKLVIFHSILFQLEGAAWIKVTLSLYVLLSLLLSPIQLNFPFTLSQF